MGGIDPEDFISLVAHESVALSGAETVDHNPELPRIGLLNIMPSPAYLKTEYQWRDAFIDRAEVVPVQFDNDPRINSRLNLGQYACRVSEVADNLDGLIITGANLERRPNGQELPFADISYHDQLTEVSP